jgi:hypothetical protein
MSVLRSVVLIESTEGGGGVLFQGSSLRYSKLSGLTR